MKQTMKMLAVSEFSDQARSMYPEAIASIVLYGSLARKEDGPDSDIDILVITREDPDLQKELSFLAFDIGMKYGIDLSVQSYSKYHVDSHSNFSFFQNVQREGIVIG